MVEKKIILNSIEATKDFVSAAARAPFEVDVVSGRYKVDGKSILGMFSLDLSKPVLVRAIADISEAGEFIEAIRPYSVVEGVAGSASIR